MAYTEEELKKQLETKEYEYGFYTDIDSETFPVGLSEEIVVAISKKKNEPKWMTEWRLDAFKIWKERKVVILLVSHLSHLPLVLIEDVFDSLVLQ